MSLSCTRPFVADAGNPRALCVVCSSHADLFSSRDAVWFGRDLPRSCLVLLYLASPELAVPFAFALCPCPCPCLYLSLRRADRCAPCRGARAGRPDVPQSGRQGEPPDQQPAHGRVSPAMRWFEVILCSRPTQSSSFVCFALFQVATDARLVSP